MREYNSQSVMLWRSLAWLAILIAGVCLIWAVFVFGLNANAATPPTVISY